MNPEDKRWKLPDPALNTPQTVNLKRLILIIMSRWPRSALAEDSYEALYAYRLLCMLRSSHEAAHEG